jgi:glutamine synthetase
MEAKLHLPELFGSQVFNEWTMKERLSSASYGAWKKCVTEGTSLDISTANEIAEAMKQWAVEKGATHYTHWFQPMTGVTAEKHDSFITPAGGGRIIMEFSGKELVRGEPDASSFPSGGLRATFEARGYTAWDPTSFAFIKEDSLCIPTIFCSYSGHALDKKTPLLRSMDEVSRQAIRILRLFGDTETRRVTAQVGPEQEYFLIDKELFRQRRDLQMTGRTLFGAKPPRGQELEDHYFGAIKPRVAAYMKDLDETLWTLGVLSKTKHNEVAPSQHEMAPIYSDANTACDHNQIAMEMMKKVADRHGLVCLLHEKPFAGVNGSGKHDNWSLSTDTGHNLFKPGSTPSQNARFLLFLAAFIKGVDDYQDFLRTTVATAGNDHRLGAQEAPPAVLSIFLGDELNAVVESIIHDTRYTDAEKKMLKVGVDVLPAIRQDNTDRNRTSPMAFTGNKFEFRMPGSSLSVSGPNIALNTIMAEELEQFADELEKAEDFQSALHQLVKRTLTEHQRIIFNGNGYDDAWLQEAERRGLLAAFYLELTTGLRRGELLALLWTDLDAESRTISVTKQVNRIKGELVISPPKTQNSVRTLAIPQQAVDLLVEEHKTHPGNPYMFPSPKTGTMYDPDAFRRTHDKILKAIGAEHVPFAFHYTWAGENEHLPAVELPKIHMFLALPR